MNIDKKMIYNNLIIRNNRALDLMLIMNREKVYFIFQHGKELFNDLNYNIVSDYFNLLENGGLDLE